MIRKCKGTRDATPTARATLERLEPRQLFNHPAPSGVWPTAPFHRKEDRDGTWVYVNQFGRATLPQQAIDAAHPFGTYDLFFDDGGALSVTAQGTVPLDLAYYPAPGAPTGADQRGDPAGAAIQAPVSPDKLTQYVAVRPHQAGANGTYQLNVAGVPVSFYQDLPIDRKSNAGSDGTTISGAGDFDFWRFTTTRAGTWVVQVIPDAKPNVDAGGPLDATLTVFDAQGNPIGGTFTRPINAGGVLRAEQWTGTLGAGQTVAFRVDGAGSSTGGYGVGAFLAADAPTLSVAVAATTPTAKVGGAPGRFTITRSVTGRRSMAVRYTVGGTAVGGRDYQPLSGVAWIPPGKASVNVDVRPVAGAAAGSTVVLALSSDPSYELGGRRHRATVTLLG